MKNTQMNCGCADVYRSDRRIRLEEDSTLPDYCSDIVRVIKVDATPFVGSRKAYVRDGTLFIDVEGNVYFNAVYVTEGGNTESYGFFANYFDSVKSDVANVDPDSISPFITVTAENVVCKVQSPRRIGMKAEVVICADVKGNVTYECFSGKGDGRVEVKEKATVSMRVEDHKDGEFKVSKEVVLPSGLPPMERMLSAKLTLAPESASSGDGKVNYWGNAGITCIYVPEYDGEGRGDIKAFYQPFEIKGSMEMEEATSDMTAFLDMAPVSFDFEIRSDALGENRILNAEFTYGVECIVTENADTIITEDIYGIASRVSPSYDRREFRRFAGTLKDTTALKEQITLKSGIDMLEGADARVQLRDVSVSDGVMTVNSRVTVNAIGMGEDTSCAVSESFDIPLRITVPSDVTSPVSFDVTQSVGFVDTRTENGNAYVSFELDTVAQLYSGETLTYVATAEVEEEEERRESLLFCYPCETDTLWSIGKKYGVGISALSRANSLSDQELKRVMVIPTE